MPSKILDLTYSQYLSRSESIQNCILDKYIILQKLAHGSVGSVYRGINDHTKKQVAIKLINLHKYLKTPSYPYLIQTIQNQITNLQQISSNHIIKIHDHYKNKQFYILILQYCNGQTLQKIIQSRKQRMKKQEIIDIMKQLMIGLVDMHSRKIIHRDIKSQNIMYSNGVLKIVDLGLSKCVGGQEEGQHSFAGTLSNMAPEVLNNQRYGLKADIWSLGIVLYQLVYGIMPFIRLRQSQLYVYIMKNDLFPNDGMINGYRPPSQILNLLRKMLEKDKKQRIGWQQLSENPIFMADKYKLPNSLPMAPSKIHIQSIHQLQLEIQQPKTLIKQQLPQNKIKNQQSQQEQSFQQSLIQKNKQSFHLNKLSGPQKLEILQQIDTKQTDQFNILKKYFLDCKITQLIFYQIIQPLDVGNKIDLKERKNIQFMYLLASRCYVNLSFLRYDTDNMDSLIVDKLRDLAAYIQGDVRKKFQKYSKLLKGVQDKFGSMISDRFLKIFNNKYIQTKDKYLVGLEISDSPLRKKHMSKSQHNNKQQQQQQTQPSNIKSLKSAKLISTTTSPTKTVKILKIKNNKIKIEKQQQKIEAGVTKKQQIQFTYEQYIIPVLFSLSKDKNPVIWQLLYKYREINMVDQKYLQGRSFDQYIQMLLK